MAIAMDLKAWRADAGDGRTRTTLVVSGIIDLHSSQTLVDAGMDVLVTGECLALDLSEADLIDATGVSGLVELAAEAERPGQTFEVIAASAQVRHVLETTGLAALWLLQDPPPLRPEPEVARPRDRLPEASAAETRCGAGESATPQPAGS